MALQGTYICVCFCRYYWIYALHKSIVLLNYSGLVLWVCMFVVWSNYTIKTLRGYCSGCHTYCLQCFWWIFAWKTIFSLIRVILYIYNKMNVWYTSFLSNSLKNYTKFNDKSSSDGALKSGSWVWFLQEWKKSS